MARIFRAVVTGVYAGEANVSDWSFLFASDVEPGAGSQCVANGMGFVDPNGVVLATPAADSLYAALLADTHEGWRISNIYVYAPYNPAGFFERQVPVTFNGESQGQPMPPYMAGAIRSNRVRRDVKRGYKRFPGVVSTMFSGGGALATIGTQWLEGVCAVVNSPIQGFSPTLNASFQICVETSPVDPETGKKTGGDFENENDAVAALAVGLSYEPFPRVTTQNSRKVGVGS